MIDLKNSTSLIEEFDGVMICNGHYHTPSTPRLLGDDTFTGKIMHSHDYRDAKHFDGRRVLVIGAGPSGMDLALQISKFASLVILSHHSRDEISTVFPKHVQMKPDVHRIEKDTAIFKDGTTVDVDTIVFCTGKIFFCRPFDFCVKSDSATG